MAFLAQFFGGLNHIFQTDTKALTYLAHYLVHNTFHFECCKDLSLALFCSAYILHRSAKSLLIINSVVTCMPMTHRFTWSLSNSASHIYCYKTISTALISSCLDYCNSLLNNIAKRDLAKLQQEQNCLAHVILKAPQFSPSLTLLKQLHWLSVSHQINFKLFTLTFLLQPPYLASG